MDRPVNRRLGIFVKLVIAMGLLAPGAFAQKPPAPSPPPSAPPPSNNSPNPSVIGSQPTLPREDLVMFILGRVATADGTPVPNNVVVERVCNARVVQQVHATSQGEFSIQLGSRVDSFVDASGDQARQSELSNRNTDMGIPRRELANCELRASVSGFSSNVVDLVDLSGSLSTVDVGAIVVQRREKVEGNALSASAYKAPKNARKAYEKGLAAEKKGNLPEAQKYFGKAVELYPKYASAWNELGNVLQKEKQKDAAREAFTKATVADAKFLPPYLPLAVMACEAENWSEALHLTNHILNLDPLDHVSGYILDLDALQYSEAYFYNALANYRLNKFAEAEKSGLKAEQVDLPTRFPQLHLMLADIYARTNNYATAISETKMYLELVPHGKNTEQIRDQLVKLERLNGGAVSE